MVELSRRDFLAVGGLSLGGLAFRPADPGSESPTLGIGRVTVDWIGIYSEPSFRTRQLHRVTRDNLITLLGRIRSDAGPSHNPIWYKILEGYIHSGHIQLVGWNPQPVIHRIPAAGSLFEVAVPYTRAHRNPDVRSDPLYRLYFNSTTWVTAALAGADGRIWYEILDDVVRIKYYARSEHLRLIPTSEIAPISVDVPLHRKRIEVNLRNQEMFCYEFDDLVFKTRISSGIPDTRPRANGIPTITPSGRFFIEVKMPSRHMGDGRITSDLDAYELPGVPWVSFFTSTGVAFHGTYWHNDFGRPKSHGCINMPPDEAKWLYRWTLPVVGPDQTRRIARGTPILIT
jgi:hypothetical protein